MLAALVLALNNDVGRDMRDPDSAVGRVDVLPARARRAIGIDAQVAFNNIDVDILVDDRIDPDAGKARLALVAAAERADPHEPVHTAFGLGIAIGVFTLEQISDRLDPRLIARMIIDRFDFHPPPLGPARVHAAKHFGPVIALGSARPGVDFDIGVVRIGLTRQQGCHFVAFRPLGHHRKLRDTIIDHAVIALGFGHFHQLDCVIKFGLNCPRRTDSFLEPPTFAHDDLSCLGIIPQRRILDHRIQLFEPRERTVPVDEPA